MDDGNFDGLFSLIHFIMYFADLHIFPHLDDVCRTSAQRAMPSPQPFTLLINKPDNYKEQRRQVVVVL
jgi:hypothetical protein